MSPDSPPQKRKSKLTKEAAEAISKLQNDRAFWEDLTVKLFHVAHRQISRWTWPGGHRPQPEHIAGDAIEAVLFGECTWKPQVHSLFHACCRVIWSRVWQELEDSKRFQSIGSDAPSAQDSPDEAGSYSAMHTWSETPLEALITEESWSELLQLLPSGNGEENKLLRRMVEEMVFSYPEREPTKAGNRPRKEGWANRELAAKLSVPESAIVNAKRRLDRILEDWLWGRFLEVLPDDGRPWLDLVNTAASGALPEDWKQIFAQKHSVTFEEVTEMGAELLELLHDWLGRTIRDAGALQKRATRIEQNILMSE